MINLVVVGSVALDTVETPFGKVSRALGGTATYGSIAASYFAEPGVVGVVGGDFGRRHINLLKKRGVDLEGLQIVPDGQTFHWSGFYEGDMNRAITRATDLNVFESFSPVIPEIYRGAPYLFLGNIQPDLQLEVLDQMKKPKLVLCDTMNYWIESVPERLTKVFRRSHVICVNDGEARMFTGKSSLPKAAQELETWADAGDHQAGRLWRADLRQGFVFCPAGLAVDQSERPDRRGRHVRRRIHRQSGQVGAFRRSRLPTGAGGRHRDGIVLCAGL
jgi:sugar/nucleoside kinase (ribokinase family)